MGWMDTLQEFDFDIIHRPSRDNIVADALSRRPDYSTPERSLLLLELTGDDDLLARIRSLAAADSTYQRVANAV